jgi:uncharacterized protein (UPF0332 family)
MPEQKFDWIGYYNLATQLAAIADEASLRSAISRAYYYVYHLAFDRACSNGFQIRDGESSHKQLWRTYSESPLSDCKELGVIGNRLREKRARADYNDAYPRLSDEVPGLLTDAKTFEMQLKALNPRFPDPDHMRQ